MIDRPYRVLLVEDDPGDALLVAEHLHRIGGRPVALTHVTALEAALRVAGAGRAPFDAVLLDLGLPDATGLDTLVRFVAGVPDVPVVVLTGHADRGVLDRAIRQGAIDAIGKDAPLEAVLPRAVRAAIDRHRAEAAARALRLLVDEEPDGLLVVDAARTVRFANRAAARLLARPLDGLVGGPASVPLAPGDETEVEVRSGVRTTVLEIHAAAIEWDGAPATLATLRDVTARRRAERERERLRTAERLAALGQLAGGIAHEFNNALQVIAGSAELLVDGLPPGLVAARELIDQILAASRRSARLTRQILAFGRQQPLELELTDLRALLARAYAMLRRLLGESIELSVEAAEGLPTAWLDAAQMEQVLVNLALNARDAMPDGGRLGIEATRAGPDDGLPPELPRGPWLRLTVRDTGVGMDAATRARAFEPFFSTKDREHGTGLGLATVYGILKQLGGDVTLESAPGAGTAVHCWVPAAAAPAPEPAPPATPAPAVAAGRGQTVLVAEDEPAILELARRALASAGYRVLTARDGPTALAVARGEPGRIDLLVSDVLMPGGISGVALCARLRAERPGLRCLFITGWAAEHAALPLDGPDTSLLRKPFGIDALLRQVAALLGA